MLVALYLIFAAIAWNCRTGANPGERLPFSISHRYRSTSATFLADLGREKSEMYHCHVFLRDWSSPCSGQENITRECSQQATRRLTGGVHDDVGKSITQHASQAHSTEMICSTIHITAQLFNLCYVNRSTYSVTGGENMATQIFKTFTYKTVDSCEIKLDLYLPPSTTQEPTPVLLRLHGGGLLQGNRAGVPPHMLRGISKYNYALVSADYRLAPQASVSEILSDVLDCLAFIRNDLAKHVEPGLLDTSRIAVVGSSAGGYLALLAALYAEPKPAVVMAIYPITNPLGAFFRAPQPHALGKIEREVVAPYLDKKAEASSGTDANSNRNKLYYWMLQEAALSDLYGMQNDDEKYVIAAAMRKHGKSGLPPIYIVHGDMDRLVGVEQSDEVARAMKEVGAVFQYERPDGLDHLFDRDEGVELEGMYSFMRMCL